MIFPARYNVEDELRCLLESQLARSIAGRDYFSTVYSDDESQESPTAGGKTDTSEVDSNPDAEGVAAALSMNI